jgi:hypothetical protein
MAAAIMLGGAIMLSHARRRRWWLAVFFVAIALLDGAPMWGADVGGVLAGLPVLALTYTLLVGWRVRTRTVVTWLVGTFGAIVALGLLDLTRASSHRTHLGRLFERIGHSGSNGFVTVVHRKLDSNFATLTNSVWRFAFVFLLVIAAYVVWKAPEKLRALRQRFPVFDACAIGLAAAAVLGYALNDSGIAVPGVMLSVGALGCVYLLTRVEEV